METLILGWYVLTATGSVVWLTAFGALQAMGTLISPFFGVASDRLGHRGVLAAMRGSYALTAGCLAVLALNDWLSPPLVFAIVLVNGLVRPSDFGMRNALIGSTMPPAILMGAMSISRLSADTARVIGALTGVGLVALMGVGPAYVTVTMLYLLAVLLLLLVRDPPRQATAAASNTPLRDLRDGLAHVRGSPALLAALWLAFLVNFAAFPLSGGLLPFVARDVYGIDRTGLGYLSACFAGGAMLGSLFLGSRGQKLPPARSMMLSTLVWFGLLAAFARSTELQTGMLLLFTAGFVQSFCMIPLAVLLLRVAAEEYRGRVMGLRMLAVYGLPVGLLIAGPMIAHWGFAGAASAFAGFGLLCTAAIGLHWRRALWPRDAAGNG